MQLPPTSLLRQLVDPPPRRPVFDAPPLIVPSRSRRRMRHLVALVLGGQRATPNVPARRQPSRGTLGETAEPRLTRLTK
jgi:hypothetical protein